MDTCDFVKYRYSCFITNLELPAKIIYDSYRGWPDSENRMVVSKKVCKLDLILIFVLSNKKQQEYGTYTRTNFGNYFELHK